MDRKLIEKVVDFVLTCRSLGFNSCDWEDLLCKIGELSPSEKASLTLLLTEHGARLLPVGIWLFDRLDVDGLRQAKEPVYTIVSRKKVPAGEWQKDNEGHYHFVRDPNFKLPEG